MDGYEFKDTFGNVYPVALSTVEYVQDGRSGYLKETVTKCPHCGKPHEIKYDFLNYALQFCEGKRYLSIKEKEFYYVKPILIQHGRMTEEQPK